MRLSCTVPNGVRYVAEGVPGKVRPAFDKVDEFLPKGGYLLDVGCGPATALVYLLSKRTDLFRYLGVDLDEETIEENRRQFSKWKIPDEFGKRKFVVGNALTADLPVHDVVVSTRVLSHYPDPSPLIHRMRRLARIAVVATVVTVPGGVDDEPKPVRKEYGDRWWWACRFSDERVEKWEPNEYLPRFAGGESLVVWHAG